MGRRLPTLWVKGRICVSYLEDMEVILDDHVISFIDKLNSVCAEVSLSLPIPSDKPTHNFVPGQQLPIQSLNIGPGQNFAQLITSRSPLKVPVFHIWVQIVQHVSHIQWGKKVFSQPPIVQVLPLKKMREACNLHHMYTSTMRDKIRKQNPENNIVGFLKNLFANYGGK